MKLTLFILCIAGLISAFGVLIVKFMHFFQLNSYRAKIHSKWLCKNSSKLYVSTLFSVILFVLASAESNWCKVFFFTLCIITALLSLPQKAKKPLVYTMRVNRMLITTAIIFAFVMFCGVYFGFGLQIGAVFILVSPAWVMVANFVNKPIEKAINNYYINDAKKLLSSSNARVIGITGSYGKTSMKYYLATLLKAKYNVLMTPESFNTPMGVVITIRSSLSALNEIFICEMGAKRVGEIKEICDIVNPEIGIITSIGPQHLETFKSLDNVKRTKFELADSLPKDGMLFLNSNDQNINEFKADKDNIGYSVNGSAPYNATDITLSDKGTKFTVTNPDGERCEFETKLIGMHNVLNITGAIAVANSLGIELKALKSRVAKLESVPHRLELINRGNDIIIDDAYNSNPSGTKAALETLSYFDGMKILLTPGMVELGAKQDELNMEFGQNASKVCDYVILVGERQTQPIYDGLKSMNYPEDKIFVSNNLSEAINHAYALNSKSQRKIILLENDLPDNY